MRAPGAQRPPGRRRTVWATLGGALLFFVVSFLLCGALVLWKEGRCSGESRPYLGSERQIFAVRGCLASDAGPLIGLSKALGLDEPALPDHAR